MQPVPVIIPFGLDPDSYHIVNQPAESGPALPQQGTLTQPRPADKQVRSASIMIVDDDDNVSQAVRKFLSDSGFQSVTLVAEPCEALGRIEMEKPDLVLLNLCMQSRGMEILRAMREHEFLQRIPVIALTDNADSTTRIEALGLGADDFLTRPVDMGELVARVRNSIRRKLDRDQLAKYSLELEVDALRDSLTGIANRRAFDYEIKRRMTEWARQRTPSSLLLVDIDKFKVVNDRLGHQQGDRVLQSVAKLVEDAVRGMDLVARYGGEEFAVIMPGSTFDESIIVGERIRRMVESARMEADGKEFRITVSVGTTESAERDTVETLFERADKALYAAKNEGRNCCRGYNGKEFRSHSAGDSARTREEVRALYNRTEATTQASRILVIDGDQTAAQLVRRMLNEADYFGVKAVSDPEKAFDKIRSVMPDIVLCNIQMPVVSGIDLLTKLREHPETQNVPVVFLASSADAEEKLKCLALGATDYLDKPVIGSEMIARVQTTLIAKAHVNYLADESNRIEREVRQRTAELIDSRREAIQCLSRAGDWKDNAAGSHAYRVGRYAETIARELGLDDERCVWLEYAAQLHDVGNIGIPDSILKKQDELTPGETETLKGHCVAGRQIILNERTSVQVGGNRATGSNGPCMDKHCSPVMKMAALVAESHHERWDGKGYPYGLKSEAIPVEGRITAVADWFDAISAGGNYKDALELEECFRKIGEGAGTQFDPAVVAAFLNRKPDVLAVFLQHKDNA